MTIRLFLLSLGHYFTQHVLLRFGQVVLSGFLYLFPKGIIALSKDEQGHHQRHQQQ